MLSRFRTIFAGVVTLGVLISTVALSSSNVYACPAPMPSTLLSLYLQSDLIVVADVTDEKEIKRSSESKHGYYASLERSLNISKILKGTVKEMTTSYSAYEYKSKVSAPGKPRRLRMSYGFRSGVPVKLGEQYLFFLRSNGKKGYYLTDRMSSVKKADADLDVFETRIDELKQIVETKENQVENLAEWLVKGIEKPATRWGSIQDLYNSSNSFENEKRYPKNKRSQNLVLDKRFRPYNSAIIKTLNDSQKARISAVLNDEIQKSWFGTDNTRTDYRLVRIVRTWDKVGLANNAFSILQGLDESNFAKKKLLMEFISNLADDSKLRNSYYRYSNVRLGGSAEMQAKNRALRLSRLNDFNTRFQFLLMRNFEPVAKK